MAAILATPRVQRSAAQQLDLTIFQQLEETQNRLLSLPAQSLIYSAAADFEPDGSMKPPPGPRPIHVLYRGDIRNPRDEVGPGAIACVTALKSRFDIPEGAKESAATRLAHRKLVD